MSRLSAIAFLAGLWLTVCAAGADACYCGAARYRCCWQPQCCIAVKTCQEVVYEEQQRTFYKTVYEEVIDKVVVDAVKYVEDTEYRCCKCTGQQPKTPECCPPASTCAPAACASPSAAEMETVEYLRKVPHTVYRPVSYQKTQERPRVVVKQVPYTVTVCVRKVVYKQVPVEVCAPVPQCCEPCE
jgi:hypothetical protein